MIYRTLLLQLDVHEPIEEKVRYGWELANRFEANLIGFAACDIAVAPMAFAGGAVVDGDLVARQTEDIENRLRSLKERFMRLTRDSNRASWRGLVSDPTRSLARQARAADLVVTAAPADPGPGSIDIGEAILAAGRPVLIMAGNRKPIEARRIVVAWKDAREARRAAVDAMPFLAHADDVLVATVEEDDRREAAESLVDMVRFLVRHGVKARHQLIATGGRTIAETLVERALEIGADLMVSGCFGHGRLREWILGGATRSLLHDHRLNRLLTN